MYQQIEQVINRLRTYKQHNPENNFWDRNLQFNELQKISFNLPIESKTVTSNSSLLSNRLLTYIYERDFVFLPDQKFDNKIKDNFLQFYNHEIENDINLLKYFLENYCVEHVLNPIHFKEEWTEEEFLIYYHYRLLSFKKDYSKFLNTILQSKNPAQGIQLLAVQQSLIFLPEISQTARMILGSYGNLQKKIFDLLAKDYTQNVSIDYKSSNFKNILKDLGLDTNLYKYWEFYLPTTLLINNFFHYLTSHKIYFFKYLGVFFFNRSILGPYSGLSLQLIKKFFTMKNVEFYTHNIKNHADSEKIIMKTLRESIKLYGTQIIPDIVLGIENMYSLQTLFYKNFLDQLTWQTNIAHYQSIGNILKKRIYKKRNLTKINTLEKKDHYSGFQISEKKKLCVVKKGSLDITTGLNSKLNLKSYESFLVQKNKTYSTFITSPECKYTFYEFPTS